MIPVLGKMPYQPLTLFLHDTESTTFLPFYIALLPKSK
jgi:hypothetical protein